MLVSIVLSLLLRLLFRRGSLSPMTLPFWIYALSLIPSVFLSRYLVKIGSARRDPTTGTLISSGEDLGRPGIIEWCFDVIYVTCESVSRRVGRALSARVIGLCQVGSGAFGAWVWWLYLIVSASRTGTDELHLCSSKIPLYAMFKLWSSVISPYVLGGSSPFSKGSSSSPPEDTSADTKQPTSKRQEKLKKRSERGDPRIRMQSR